MNVRKFVYVVVAVLIVLLIVLPVINRPEPVIVPVQLHCGSPGDISTCKEVNEIDCVAGAPCGFGFRLSDPSVTQEEVLWNLHDPEGKFRLTSHVTTDAGIPWYTGIFSEPVESRIYIEVTHLENAPYEFLLGSADFLVNVTE